MVFIDFGIATSLASDMSKKFTQTRGTPMYQSPESYTGGAVQVMITKPFAFMGQKCNSLTEIVSAFVQSAELWIAYIEFLNRKTRPLSNEDKRILNVCLNLKLRA